MRVAIVIASTWSCVTYRNVAPSLRCRAMSSALVALRSFASRFDSGSSMRNGPRIANHGARQGDSLPLAARQRGRAAAQQRSQLERRGHLRHLLGDQGAGQPPGPERERDIAFDREMRIQRVTLEDHGKVPLLRGRAGDVAAVEQDASGGRRLQTGDQA